MTKLTVLQKENRRMKRAKNRADKAVGRLKKTIMFIDVGHMTYEQWVKYRVNYLGGSDAATYTVDEQGNNLNPYQSKLELFHEKVGVITKTGDETEATYSGHVSEDHVVKHYWQYHDMGNPDFDTLKVNAANEKAVRYARRVKDKIMYDPRFPHIKINIDGFIQNTRFEKAPRGVLEIKTGLTWVWNQYEAEIPVFYVIQAQVYMLVTGLKYCEIAVLLDGRYFKVFPMEANKDIQDKILNDAEEFWALVQEGILIWNDPDLNESQKIEYLSHIEPPVDGSSAVDKYLKERFRSDYKVGRMMINDELIDFGQSYLDATARLKIIDEEKRSYANIIKKVFLDQKVDEIVSVDGKVLISHRRTEEGKPLILRVNKAVNNL